MSKIVVDGVEHSVTIAQLRECDEYAAKKNKGLSVAEMRKQKVKPFTREQAAVAVLKLKKGK